jgi:fibronectin-binding autotransporter adhesin
MKTEDGIMKLKHMIVAVMLFVMTLVVCADTFTWDGGGSDDNWLTNVNWDPDGIPDNDGSAVLNFSGNTRNGPINDFAANTAFAGINLFNDGSAGKTAAFTLSGNTLTLGGNISTTGSSSTIADEINLNMVLSTNRTITANSLHDLTVNGIISESGGSQGLKKEGGGKLFLKGVNTYSGKTEINSGTTYFYSLKNIGEGGSALGAPTTVADGTIDLKATLEYKGGESTSDRSINLTGGHSLRNNGSGTLTFTKGVTGVNRGFSVRGSRNITINGLVDLGSGGIGRTDPGTLTLACPTNSFSGSISISAGTISVETISDSGVISALGQGTSINMGQNGWNTIGKLLFNGTAGGSCNRAISVEGTEGSITSGGIIENSVAGKMLTLSGNVAVKTSGRTPRLQLIGDGDGEMSGVISAGMLITKSGAGTWTLSGANTYVGTTRVSTGTLLINGSTASGSAIVVDAGGTLGGTGTVHGVINAVSGGTLTPGVDGIGTLTLDNGSAADLTLNSNTIECDLSNVVGSSDLIAISGTLVVNGANTIEIDFPDGPAPYGTYTVMTYDAKSGSGTLAVDQTYDNVLVTVGATNVTLTIVDTSTVTWQGDGIANAWDKSTANWSSGTYVDNDTVLFDDTGSASPDINIAEVVEPFSVSVDSDTNNYTIGGAAIAGSAGLIKSGDSVLTLTGHNTYGGLTTVNAGTLALNGGSLSNSSVNVAPGATFTEDADGVIAGAGIGFTARGSSILAGSNTYDGVTTVGVIGTPNIILTVRNNQALGSTLNGVTLYGGDNSTESRVRIDVDGVVIKDETLTFAGSGKRAGLQYYRNSGAGTWDGNLVLAGALCYLNSEFYGGTLVIGGTSVDTITGSGGSISLRGSGTIVLNSTINIGSDGLQRDDAGTCVINSTSNTLGYLNVLQGTFKLGVENALPSTTRLTIGKSGNIAHGKFDLNGKSQTIGNLAELHNTSVGGGTQKILSSTPATLIVSNTTANTFGLTGSSIEGEVTLVKMGTESLTLTSTNTTAGSFIVSNGTLVVSSTGSFGENSTNVTVAAGTLTLQSSVSISDSATLTIADGGAKVSLDAGVNESVDYLILGDAPKSATTYGATGSGAAVIDDTHFAGSGILTVLRDTSGTMILVR